MFRWKKRRNKRRIRLSVSPALVVLLFLFALIDRQKLLLQILLAAGLHECGHFFALRLFGGEIDALRLTAFGAEMRIRHSERLSYSRELAAVLAGPAVNLLCALLLGRMAVALDWERGYMLSGIHMLLALFNLLPMRALDGGRALELAVSWRWDPEVGDRIARWTGAVAALALAVCLEEVMRRTGGSLWLLPALAGLLVAAGREVFAN